MFSIEDLKPITVDFAFWTGNRFICIFIIDNRQDVLFFRKERLLRRPASSRPPVWVLPATAELPAAPPPVPADPAPPDAPSPLVELPPQPQAENITNVQTK